MKFLLKSQNTWIASTYNHVCPTISCFAKVCSGRLFESPLPIPPAMTSSSPKPDQIDEIISEENSLEDEMDVIPIETRIMGRDPSSNDLMKNILERIKSLEKMTTNQKMRRLV